MFPSLIFAASQPAPMILLGFAFILVWLAASIAWGALLFMGGVMANDAGRAAAGDHARALGLALFGAVLVGLAGAPGGLAFIVAAHRAALVWAFVALLVAGLALQVYAFWSFAAAAR